LTMGRSVLYLVHLIAEDKVMICTYESHVSKTKNKIFLTSPFFAFLILLPSELFWIVISCKTVKLLIVSVKFKFIDKIATIHEKFLALCSMLQKCKNRVKHLQGPAPRVLHPCCTLSVRRWNVKGEDATSPHMLSLRKLSHQYFIPQD